MIVAATNCLPMRVPSYLELCAAWMEMRRRGEEMRGEAEGYEI